MFTQKIIANIARETKEVCNQNGYGRVINVFSNGATIMGIDQNDCIARSDAGGWDHRIACLKYPMSVKQVKDYLTQL